MGLSGTVFNRMPDMLSLTGPTYSSGAGAPTGCPQGILPALRLRGCMSTMPTPINSSSQMFVGKCISKTIFKPESRWYLYLARDS